MKTQVQPSTAAAQTLVDVLLMRAARHHNRIGYTFLIDGEAEEVNLSYGELDLKARAVAAKLQSLGARGERVLLLYPSGLPYIVALFGCLYAGAVAAPAYLPHPRRSSLRLEAIIKDAQPMIILTDRAGLSRVNQFLARIPSLKTIPQVFDDEVAEDWEELWECPRSDGDSPALIQYTSGSTSTPKGVLISHQNLLHNERQIEQAFQQTEQSVIVGWLPLYHDMGLIGNLFHSLYVGARCVMMSPTAFLQRPFRWLNAVSNYRATTSGGPSFAYDLCVRRITPQQRAALDLSSWELAFNGAEPVRAKTMRAFQEAFEPCGLRRAIFFPCYGLAEATLFVCARKKGQMTTSRTVQTEALESNRIVEAPESGLNVRKLVGCGVAPADLKIVTVDPQTKLPCSADQVGEIWVSGPNVASGYWNNPEETENVFRARLADTGEGPFLRTGDLGFLKENELFITGRLKDLIIIRGRNHYPQDIEWSVEQADSSIRPGCGAAFSIDLMGEERLVIVHEVERNRNDSLQGVIDKICRRVTYDHDLQAHAVILVRPGTIPKTSSGKIQRRACREAYLAGRFEAIASWSASLEAGPDSAPLDPPEPSANLDEIRAWLVSSLALKLRRTSDQIDVKRPFIQYGLDSLAAVELAHSIENSFNVTLPIDNLFEQVSIDRLAERIFLEKACSNAGKVDDRPSESEPVKEYPLSYGQQALWFLQKLSPESPVYNLAFAAEIPGDVDSTTLREAFQWLTDRHPCMRTVFSEVSGAPIQRVLDHSPVSYHEIDASSWSEEDFDHHLNLQAWMPFDPEGVPPLRIRLYTRSRQRKALLFVIHHLVADFWSLALLAEELPVLYEAARNRRSPALPAIGSDYQEYVRRQRESLAGGKGDRHLEYWRERLALPLPVLNLHTCRVRPPVQTFNGATEHLIIDRDTVDELRAFSWKMEATLYMSLLAVFQTLLFRYSQQEDLLVGSLTAGRASANWARVVGYFVNPIVSRADFSANPSFDRHLQNVRREALSAFEHQDYPFFLLVEKLKPERDPSRSPVFQTMFTLQKTTSLAPSGIEALAIGEAGARVNLSGLSLESIALKQTTTQFDLTLLAAEIDDKLRASIQYNIDLFDRPDVERMLFHFERLLKGAVAHPDLPLSELPMIGEEERRQILFHWNPIGKDAAEEHTLHELFERQVERSPSTVALIYRDLQVTYADLNRRANQLADYLIELGVTADTPVGVCVERSIEMVVCLLAALKAGGAYVPLDPGLPQERLALLSSDAGTAVILTQNRSQISVPDHRIRVVCVDPDCEQIADRPTTNPRTNVSPDNLAYIIYTSGSTGKPKGVMVSHRNVTEFFSSMDESIGSDPPGVWLAVTGISFDISVVELIWTLTRGFTVIVHHAEDDSQSRPASRRRTVERSMDFSLFYFASDESSSEGEKYRLLLEGAKFADRHGFRAVWTPERHFHNFGGLYPNPAITGAAIAAITENIQIRAGSVVLPLHHPVRVAEDWAVVDNLSGGRVGISFASGWHVDDFVLNPENYVSRKEIMCEQIEKVRGLWRGETLRFPGAVGQDVEVRTLPRPVQKELPIWITAAGSLETFQLAGRLGAGVLTHLLSQDLDDLSDKVMAYRKAWKDAGHGPGEGHVALMLHAFIGHDLEVVRETVRQPFCDYLMSSYGLIMNFARSIGSEVDLYHLTEEDKRSFLARAFDRYFTTSGLFGTPDLCFEMIERLKAIGVDEVACLIDFGVDPDEALKSLRLLNELRQRSNGKKSRPGGDFALASQIRNHGVTHLQCTPSGIRRMILDPDLTNALGDLNRLMLGGEALSPTLVKELRGSFTGALQNLYGPTEATVWCSSYTIDDMEEVTPIGRPLSNARAYILNNHLQPLPVKITGELYIGGQAVARGYLNNPELTAERFLPDPFSPQSGLRFYKTGDLARFLPGGQTEYLGRADHQVKIHGHRIETGEIEYFLERHPEVKESAVIPIETSAEFKGLAAYIVPVGERKPDGRVLRDHLKSYLPNYMIPTAYVLLNAFPLTTNGKLDRKKLPPPNDSSLRQATTVLNPRNELEEAVAKAWESVLVCDQIGVRDNFFEIGGNSLLAMQVISHLRKTFPVDFTVRDFFESPTIEAIAETIDEMLIKSIDQLSEEEVNRLLPQ
jgi:natural product biosynthesis luciferase-like monooxygenase protein